MSSPVGSIPSLLAGVAIIRVDGSSDDHNVAVDGASNVEEKRKMSGAGKEWREPALSG